MNATIIGGMMIGNILRDELKIKAATYDAANLTPQLIRKLAVMEVGKQGLVDIRTDQGIRLGGWDGITTSLDGGMMVPKGNAVWEISAREDVENKATEDYEKRTNESNGTNQKETTYIAATLRSWGKKDEWALERKKDGKWKEILTFDVDSIAGWLERWPSVAAWFNWKSGNPNSGIISIEEYTTEFFNTLDVAPPMEIFNAGRNEASDAIQKWLSDDQKLISIKGDSRDEAIMFLASEIERLPEKDKEYIRSKTIVVENKEALRSLRGPVDQPRDIILVIDDEDISPSGNELRGFSKVIHPVDVRLNSRDSKIVTLEDQSQKDFISCLTANDFDQDRAENLAEGTNGKIKVLLRKLGNKDIPDWAQAETAAKLTPLLLLGSWNVSNENDKNIVKKMLLGKEYIDFEKYMQSLVNLPDTPVRKHRDSWSLVSRKDSWRLLSKFITDEELSAFKEIALEVLREYDPAYDLDIDDRYMASIKGKNKLFSASLRGGLAEALVMLSFDNTDIEAMRAYRVEDYTASIIRPIFNPKWTTWASLGRNLELIAEASPEVFLDVLEESLDDPNGVVKFLEQRSTMNSGPITNLMWAIEIVASFKESYPRACLLLARLAQADIDYDGNIVNGPNDSLNKLLNPMFPQTSADKDTIFEVLSSINSKLPDLSWKLHRSLIPKHNGLLRHNAKPKFKKAYNLSRKIPYKTIFRYFDHAKDIFLDLCKKDECNIPRLFKNVFEDLNEINQERIINELAAPDSEEVKSKIWLSIRDILANKKKFPDAEWVISDKIEEKLSLFQEKFIPNDKAEEFRWLFDDQWPDLPEPYEDYKRTEKEIARLRREAVENIIANNGKNGILNFAKTSQYPFIVGRVLGDTKGDISKEILSGDWQEGDWFYNFFSGICLTFFMKQPELINDFFNEFSQKDNKDAIKTMLVHLGCTAKTWELVESAKSKEIKDFYWQRAHAFPEINSEEEFKYFIEALLKAERTCDALRAVYNDISDRSEDSYLEGKDVLSYTNQTIDIVVEQTLKGNSHTMVGHYLGQILDFVEENSLASLKEIALLEWRIFPLINGPARKQKSIYKWLGQEPSLFCDMVRFLYKMDNGETEKSDLTDEQKENLSSASYNILSHWKGFPGIVDGNLNLEAFNRWIDSANSINEQNNRLRVSGIETGKILARSPKGPNDEWPHKIVADFIENQGTKEIKNNFRMGIYNNRGIVSKSLGEGGEQERALAKHYKEKASFFKTSHPSVSRILEQIADGYLSEGKRADHEHEEYDD